MNQDYFSLITLAEVFQAEEAMNFYVSVFRNSKALGVTRYGETGPGPSGSMMTAAFEIEGESLLH
jgi:predicted 3-demethylubiquinone-9 3-methyltransferase (glyoxalase superfamily)